MCVILHVMAPSCILIPLCFCLMVYHPDALHHFAFIQSPFLHPFTMTIPLSFMTFLLCMVYSHHPVPSRASYIPLVLTQHLTVQLVKENIMGKTYIHNGSKLHSLSTDLLKYLIYQNQGRVLTNINTTKETMEATLGLANPSVGCPLILNKTWQMCKQKIIMFRKLRESAAVYMKQETIKCARCWLAYQWQR